MIEQPKKERRFLKTLGRVGEIILEKVLIRLGSNLIKKIGGKKTLPSILFLFLSISLFAQYPNTGNKQRLGFQTTGDGLMWRGSISDTATIQPINNQNAWVILDTVNLKIYSFDFTSNVWNPLPQGTTLDTTSLSNRINLKVNISDTASMLLPYAKKSYVDTAGRFYARQDFSNVTTSTLTWTQTDTLVTAGVNVVQVYRNGQILLPSQYTIPTKTSVVIAATSFKLGENYTVIFPKGGGGAGSGGSGSLTSISAGTGIIVSPDPITTTGTVSANLNVLMELSDTVSLSNRINTKLTATDTASLSNRINLKLTATDSASLSNRINLKLNATDTASLSNRIDAKGTGTVTSVATGYGLSGGTITSTGTLVLDSAVVFSRIRDSIVDVAIGNDTIKILKQEYTSVTTSVLTWTVTPKFPIQSKSFILVFRNGQLLINDQYNLTDTNKITIVSNSFKVGANYTVVTVSGIGSVGTGVFPNPVYPEAGIALSTGSAWASSIPNNSSNWNIAFNDKINNAEFTGTNTKTLTLTQYDGGTLTALFTDLQGIVAADTASMLNPYLRKADTSLLNLNSRFATKLNLSDTSSMLTNYLRSGVAASTYQTILTNPVTGTGISSFLPRFTGTSTLDSTRLFYSSGRLGINMDASEAASHLTSRFVIRDFGHNFKFDGSAAGSGYTTTFSHDDTGLKIGQSSNIRDIRFTLNGISGLTIANNNNSPARAVGIGNDSPSHQLDVTGTLRATGATTLGSTLAVTGNITEGGNNVLTSADTTSMLLPYLRKTDTASLSNRIDLKLNKTDTATMLNPYWRSGKFSGTLPIVNGGTGATSASVARSTLDVGYVFVESTAGSSITLSSNRIFIVNTGGASTTSIDLTTATNGRQYMIKNLATGTVISTASNVIPYIGGSPGTAILSAGNVTPQWVTLVADGTNWHIMQKN